MRVRTQSCIDVMVSECVLHALANEVRLSSVCTLRNTLDKITYDSGDSRGFYIRFIPKIAFIDLNKLLLKTTQQTMAYLRDRGKNTVFSTDFVEIYFISEHRKIIIR
jgi:hypothetical protein